MKYGPLIFLAAFFALSASWSTFVLAPQLQIGRDQQTNAVYTAEPYPPGRPGLARLGQEVYRANGCAYCHSQQVRQTGVECDLVLADLGTNPVAVAEALVNARVGVEKASPPALAAGLPKTVKPGLTIDAATIAAGALKSAGAKAEVSIVPLGPDIKWGWGLRRTVAQDFLFDDVVLLGSQRVGPDLANIGLRRPDENWQLLHLYAPKLAVKDSSMPAYRFLFEKRKIGQRPSPDALQFPKEAPTPEGFEIVPRPEARALAAYLLSLRANAPLVEAPMSAPPAPANAATNTLPK
jgi:cbb3-type cytochrome oxidase cytochrome c subunit